MVRQVRDTPAAWKPMLAICVAAGALLWHLLACTESPMAFSPDGKDLAFVTAEPAPFGGKDGPAKGKNVYRLMVLTGGKKLRVIEQMSDEMLTAPAYSPDGKHLCYMRMKLWTVEEEEAAGKRMEERKKQWKKTMPTPAEAEKLFGAEDLTLPPFEDAVEVLEDGATGEPLEAVLVVRDAKTYAVVATVAEDFPAGEYGPESLGMIYALIRPQYSPDGKWIYFWNTHAAVAVNPQAEQRRILACPAKIPTLSPDGKTLAILLKNAIGLVRTDGKVATYRRWEQDVAPLGMVWKDNRTLAVLTEAKADEGKKRRWGIRLLKTDGTFGKPVPLDLPELKGEHFLVELALAPNGRHMVICSGLDVLFMKADGKLLRHWKAGDKKVMMFRPTFTPDSKRVAVKYLTGKDDRLRTSAIVFFTPEGKEIGRVAIPAAKPPASKPAEKES